MASFGEAGQIFANGVSGTLKANSNHGAVGFADWFVHYRFGSQYDTVTLPSHSELIAATVPGAN